MDLKTISTPDELLSVEPIPADEVDWQAIGQDIIAYMAEVAMALMLARSVKGDNDEAVATTACFLQDMSLLMGRHMGVDFAPMFEEAETQ